MTRQNITASCLVLQAELHLVRPLSLRRAQRPSGALKKLQGRVEERVDELLRHHVAHHRARVLPVLRTPSLAVKVQRRPPMPRLLLHVHHGDRQVGLVHHLDPAVPPTARRSFPTGRRVTVSGSSPASLGMNWQHGPRSGTSLPQMLELAHAVYHEPGPARPTDPHVGQEQRHQLAAPVFEVQGILPPSAAPSASIAKVAWLLQSGLTMGVATLSRVKRCGVRRSRYDNCMFTCE